MSGHWEKTSSHDRWSDLISTSGRRYISATPGAVLPVISIRLCARAWNDVILLPVDWQFLLVLHAVTRVSERAVVELKLNLHSTPPFCGWGLLQCLCSDRWPVPQVTEHWVSGAHTPQLPFTTTWKLPREPNLLLSKHRHGNNNVREWGGVVRALWKCDLAEIMSVKKEG